MTKLLAVLLAVTIACSITVYATAAPSSNPALMRQVAALKSRVKGLEIAVSSNAKLADCEYEILWFYAGEISHAVRHGLTTVTQPPQTCS